MAGVVGVLVRRVLRARTGLVVMAGQAARLLFLAPQLPTLGAVVAGQLQGLGALAVLAVAELELERQLLWQGLQTLAVVAGVVAVA